MFWTVLAVYKYKGPSVSAYHVTVVTDCPHGCLLKLFIIIWSLWRPLSGYIGHGTLSLALCKPQKPPEATSWFWRPLLVQLKVPSVGRSGDHRGQGSALPAFCNIKGPWRLQVSNCERFRKTHVQNSLSYSVWMWVVVSGTKPPWIRRAHCIHGPVLTLWSISGNNVLVVECTLWFCKTEASHLQ